MAIRPYKKNITIHYSLFTIHYSLFTIHYSLFTLPYTLHPLFPHTLHPTPSLPDGGRWRPMAALHPTPQPTHHLMI
ncbi:hypothetical protein H6G72_29470 [Planktothricoides sp. FACHB-1370]|uniref:Uncharacterized protein n=1 Tax=Planktothricoides raciborskii FACHB-1370 TaxID=2949576 RepID=A0ABR8EQL8_9CYAN|nr:hypothetical protein [Planktothricoides raciborskii FACHB-1370]